MTLKKNDPLRLDVSYLVKGSPGTYKEFEFNFPQLVFSPDLTLVDILGKISVSVTEDGVVADGDLAKHGNSSGGLVFYNPETVADKQPF